MEIHRINDNYQKLLEAVDKLPKEAIEHVSREVNRKGYDTTGYQYQFLVNILNEVLGIDGWNFNYTILKEVEGAWGTGKKFWDITVDIEIDIGGTKRKCVGGHKAEGYADALKGAITNGFKKTVAFFGVGKKAYEGTIDDDYRPLATPDAIKSPRTRVAPRTIPSTPITPIVMPRASSEASSDAPLGAASKVHLKKSIVELLVKLGKPTGTAKECEDAVRELTGMPLLPEAYVDIIVSLQTKVK